MSQSSGGRTYTQEEVIYMLSFLHRCMTSYAFGATNYFPWEPDDGTTMRQFDFGFPMDSNLYKNLVGKGCTLLESVIPEGKQLDAAKSMLRTVFEEGLDKYWSACRDRFIQCIQHVTNPAKEGEMVGYHPWSEITKMLCQEKKK